jgi:RimJ/RimL family protein N-acetyltransferase
MPHLSTSTEPSIRPSKGQSVPFTFTPITDEQHLSLLYRWLSRPHVAAWWTPTPTLRELRQDYLVGPDMQADGTRACIAHLHGEPVGFIQCYVVMGSGDGWWEDETDPGARGIDQFLADEARLGQGLGRAMIRAFVAGLFTDPSITTVQTDPHPANERAIRCYRAAGFAAVGPVVTPDGEALLMRCTRAMLAGLPPSACPTG